MRAQMGNGAGTRSTLARMSASRYVPPPPGRPTGRNPVEVTPKAEAHFARVLGQQPSPQLVAAMAGALPGEQVRADGMTISTTDAQGGRHYILLSRSEGGPALGNGGYQAQPGSSIVAETDPRRLGEQMRAARSLGVEHIFVKSSGDAASYRLAQMGFDRELSAIIPHETKGEQLPAALAGARTIQDLMASPAGRAWVHEYVHTPGLNFDVQPGSPSMRAYLRFRRHG